MVVHVKRYDASGPYVYARYACAPPFLGSEAPSSANELAPVHERSAATAHMNKLALTLCVYATITPGDELVCAAATTTTTTTTTPKARTQSQNKRRISEGSIVTDKIPEPIFVFLGGKVWPGVFFFLVQVFDSRDTYLETKDKRDTCSDGKRKEIPNR
jgi:hypothetical protein